MSRMLVWCGCLLCGSTVVTAAEAPRMVTLSVTIATGSDAKLAKLGEAVAVAATVAELEQAGQLSHITRLQFSALEEQAVQFQFGESTSVITGRTFGPFAGRGSAPGGQGSPQSVANYVREQTGTLVTATAKVIDSGVLAELAVEQTRFDKAKPAEENELNVAPPAKGTLVAKSTVTISPDAPVLLGGFTTTTEGGTETTVVLVTAKASGGQVAAAAVPPNAPISRAFSLQRLDVDALRKTLESLLPPGKHNAIVDARTNSLVVTADATMLEMIEELLEKLGEAPVRTNTRR
jgi:hypothetical protein